MDRRQFLAGTGLLVGTSLVSCNSSPESAVPPNSRLEEGTPEPGGWPWVRQQFNLSLDKIHCSALLISSHPTPVQQAIDQYRRELNADPVTSLEEHNAERKRDVQSAAARYLQTNAANIALTDSTTMGISLVYQGLQLQEEDEVITTEHDYYATHEALRLSTARNGANVRKIPLYEESAEVSIDEMVGRIRNAITDNTRVLALTWVHSDTGIKLPLEQIGTVVSEINSRRTESDRIIICVDGVHGFGVEDFTIEELGIDFFMAGCHKWLFGPRGTGIVWGRSGAWNDLIPTIPSFMSEEAWEAWANDRTPSQPVTAARVSPGGFKPFEHQWAMADTFRFHEEIGKARIEERTHRFARQLKEGLADMSHVTLHTPLDQQVSAGIVSFSVEGLSPWAVVNALRARDIIATTTPYATSYPRLTPSIRNTPEEITAIADAIESLA